MKNKPTTPDTEPSSVLPNPVPLAETVQFSRKASAETADQPTPPDNALNDPLTQVLEEKKILQPKPQFQSALTGRKQQTETKRSQTRLLLLLSVALFLAALLVLVIVKSKESDSQQRYAASTTTTHATDNTTTATSAQEPQHTESNATTTIPNPSAETASLRNLILLTEGAYQEKISSVTDGTSELENGFLNHYYYFDSPDLTAIDLSEFNGMWYETSIISVNSNLGLYATDADSLLCELSIMRDDIWYSFNFSADVMPDCTVYLNSLWSDDGLYELTNCEIHLYQDTILQNYTDVTLPAVNYSVGLRYTITDATNHTAIFSYPEKETCGTYLRFGWCAGYTQGDSPSGSVSISSGHLNLRDAPSTTASVLAQLKDGTPLSVLYTVTTPEGEIFYYVEYCENAYGTPYSGYVSADYVKLSYYVSTFYEGDSTVIAAEGDGVSYTIVNGMVTGASGNVYSFPTSEKPFGQLDIE